jgi:hypothetical protein
MTAIIISLTAIVLAADAMVANGFAGVVAVQPVSTAIAVGVV